jgi:hypothetical protein
MQSILPYLGINVLGKAENSVQKPLTDITEDSAHIRKSWCLLHGEENWHSFKVYPNSRMLC